MKNYEIIGDKIKIVTEELIDVATQHIQDKNDILNIEHRIESLTREVELLTDRKSYLQTRLLDTVEKYDEIQQKKFSEVVEQGRVGAEDVTL